MQFEAIVILFPFIIYSHFSGTELEMEFMERAVVVEELTWNIEKLESENKALKEEAREQGSHVEVLTKENLDVQRKIKAAPENNGMLSFFCILIALIMFHSFGRHFTDGLLGLRTLKTGQPLDMHLSRVSLSM